MPADPICRLSDKQRQCLRLVYAHHSSKEIAPILGVEPNTVDQYIKAAMKILGAADRRAAARMLAEHEGGADRPLVYQPLGIATAPDPVMFRPSTEGRRDPAFGGAMREDRAVFDAVSLPTPHSFRPPLRIGGTRPNDFGRLSRLLWIFGLILLVALAFGTFVAGVEALSRLGRTLG